jgi:16S rRNA (cytidine1402-2'-O)-methyltransferase
MAGTLFVVATPIGNLEDITARALRVLRDVTIIAAEDTRRTAHLLTRYGITTRTTSLHQHNEHRKTSELIERLLSGASVALVSDAGTPTLSDPGGHLVREAARQGVRVEPIPGPSAAITALSASGFAGESFTFLGFPPTKAGERKRWLDQLSRSSPLAIFYEAPHRIKATLEDVLASIGDVEVLLARELTKIHETLVRGPISNVLRELPNPVGEYTVVLKIGQLTDIERSEAPDGSDVWNNFCYLTEKEALTRRQAIAKLSRKYGLSARDVYAAIESHKKSVL